MKRFNYVAALIGIAISLPMVAMMWMHSSPARADSRHHNHHSHNSPTVFDGYDGVANPPLELISSSTQHNLPSYPWLHMRSVTYTEHFESWQTDPTYNSSGLARVIHLQIWAFKYASDPPLFARGGNVMGLYSIPGWDATPVIGTQSYHTPADRILFTWDRYLVKLDFDHFSTGVHPYDDNVSAAVLRLLQQRGIPDENNGDDDDKDDDDHNHDHDRDSHPEHNGHYSSYLPTK